MSELKAYRYSALEEEALAAGNIDSSWYGDEAENGYRTMSGVHMGDRPSSLLHRLAPSRCCFKDVCFCFFGLSLLLSTSIIWIARSGPCTESVCTRMLSAWSPALEAIEYDRIPFHLAFDERNVFKAPPSLEVDQAWQNITLRTYIGLLFATYLVLRESIKESEADGEV